MEANTGSELGLTDAESDHVRRILRGEAPGRVSKKDLPVGSRQILLVESQQLIAANYVDSAASGKLFSASVLLLKGKPSASSDKRLNAAYVTFVADAAKLRRPSYHVKRGIIYLFLHHRHLPTVLSQIREAKLYCWIGRFSGGHVYGDLHTSH